MKTLRTKDILKSATAIFAVLAAAGILSMASCSNSAASASSSAAAGGQMAAGTGFPDWDPASNKAFNDQIRKIIAAKNLTTVKIAFTNPYMSEYYNEIYAGAYTMMKELQEEYGVRFQYVQSSGATHADFETQIAAIKVWANEGYDAVVVCTAAEPSAMDAVFGDVVKQGLYPYFFNMPPRVLALEPDSQLANQNMNARAIVGYDNFLAHYDAGMYLARLLTMKYGEPRGEIGQVWGPGGTWSTERNQGFMAAMKHFPNIKIVPLVRGVYDRDSGMKGAEQLLSLHPELDVLYGENEEMALGAAAYVLSQGKQMWDFQTKKGIIVIGADGLLSGDEEIRAGRLTASVNVNPVENGRDLINAIFWDRVVGWQIPKIILAPTTVVDKTNVDLSEAYLKWAESVKYPSGGF